LRHFINLVTSTIRTNHYIKNEGGYRPYLSLKFDASLVDDMPLPRPKYEIFVYSTRFEAVHLRGGKVARGGLRWSDRREDFRTEILGLVKAQMVKNAVIVPTGSKGGFVLKSLTGNESREDFMKEGVACYKNMIRGLLDVTDNIKNNAIIHPEMVVRHDEDDTYLVVAADKGTATFSDYANGVSAEYGFWLGDAFASGGSQGYDHKVMGITARGAWESVRRHFKEMNMNPEVDPITVVGVGDMAGDVFGNGMLLSKSMKLVAAFNHMHIFLDPAPDAEKSFVERQRLFNLPRSTWMDYSPSLISQGGGVLDRKAKSLDITPEVQKLLGIPHDKLTPNQLIQYILRASVDLIWFGGIGTYVKSINESHEQVGDRANDALRINGSEIGARVVAEGANLGVTQKGRIEYALKGGRINTDAIDNSAGVDCSDHEVNIKILLGQTIEEGILKEKDRDELLVSMTDDVARLVLQDNIAQNQTLSFSQAMGRSLFSEQVRLMHDLEKQGLLKRSLESLPDDLDINRRMAEGGAFTRPELCVLLAYAKMSMKNDLLGSTSIEMPYFQKVCASYFPEVLQKQFMGQINGHPLKKEIVATLLTNHMVGRMGLTFVSEMTKQWGRDAAEVLTRFAMIEEIFSLGSIWESLGSLPGVTMENQQTLYMTLYTQIKQLMGWFMRSVPFVGDPGEQIDLYKDIIQEFSRVVSDYLTSSSKDEWNVYLMGQSEKGIPDSLSRSLFVLQYMVASMDIVAIAKHTGQSIQNVTHIYFALNESMGFQWLRKSAQDLPVHSHWQEEAVRSIVVDLFDAQRRLVFQLLGREDSGLLDPQGSFNSHVLENPSALQLLEDLKGAGPIDLAMLTVAAKQLENVALTTVQRTAA